MKCTVAGFFCLWLFLAFLALSFSAAGNITFIALVSFCKGTICGRVICNKMHCCNLVLFLAFSGIIGLVILSSWEDNFLCISVVL